MTSGSILELIPLAHKLRFFSSPLSNIALLNVCYFIKSKVNYSGILKNIFVTGIRDYLYTFYTWYIKVKLLYKVMVLLECFS